MSAAVAAAAKLGVWFVVGIRQSGRLQRWGFPSMNESVTRFCDSVRKGFTTGSKVLLILISAAVPIGIVLGFLAFMLGFPEEVSWLVGVLPIMGLVLWLFISMVASAEAYQPDATSGDESRADVADVDR